MTLGIRNARVAGREGDFPRIRGDSSGGLFILFVVRPIIEACERHRDR